MKPKFLSSVLFAGSTAVLIAGPVIVLLLLGIWLDGLLHTSPFIALSGGLLGFIGSIISLIKLLKTVK